MDEEQPRLHLVGIALSVNLDSDVHNHLLGGTSPVEAEDTRNFS
jgi:hypothetical protein